MIRCYVIAVVEPDRIDTALFRPVVRANSPILSFLGSVLRHGTARACMVQYPARARLKRPYPCMRTYADGDVAQTAARGLEIPHFLATSIHQRRRFNANKKEEKKFQVLSAGKKRATRRTECKPLPCDRPRSRKEAKKKTCGSNIMEKEKEKRT